MKLRCAIGVTVAACLLTAGCSSSSKNTKQASVGEAINFSAKVVATVDKVVDPATPSEGTTPPSGQRYVAFEFKLVNNGTDTYADNPAKALLLDDKGHTYTPVQVMPEVVSDMISGKSSTGSSIPAGDSAIGVVVFAVPTDTKIATAQLVDTAGKPGQWKLA